MEEPNGLDAHNGCTVFCRYAIFDCSIFFYHKIDMFFVSLKTRYDINLVAARQHIECVSTYRVCKTYRKSRTRFISTKKRQISLSKSVFFSGGRGWIRTTEVTDNRFTVCPLWPLGNSPWSW